ncbi:MAG: HupE/UreJ family protein [Pseudomonadota bacterium]
MRALLLVLFVLSLGAQAMAHVTELAVLRISEFAEGQYTVSWELRPNVDGSEALEPIFPDHCTYEEPQLSCGDLGLVGRIGFEAIGSGQSAALFKIRSLEDQTAVYTLTPSEPFVVVDRFYDATGWAGISNIVTSYIRIGIGHILLGIDHLLFVLGLIYIARTPGMMLKTITAFTIAHSLTLAAVTFGWVGVPENFVNAMIALSIVYIGVEVINLRAERSTLTLRHPWAVSFFFGLLHGFGFANALVSLGLPDGAVPWALVAFNIGVEIGQIAFVLLVLALGWALRSMRVSWSNAGPVFAAYTIGSLGAFWFFQRIEVLLNL